MIWKLLTGVSMKVWGYVAIVAAALLAAAKYTSIIKDNTVADIQEEETELFEESRRDVVKEIRKAEGLSTSDLVDRMRSRHD